MKELILAERGADQRARIQALHESGRAAELQAAAEAAELQAEEVDPRFTGSPEEAILAHDDHLDRERVRHDGLPHVSGRGSQRRSRFKNKKKGERVCGCRMTQCEHLSPRRGRKPLPAEKRGVSLTVWLAPELAARARRSGNASKFVSDAMRHSPQRSGASYIGDLIGEAAREYLAEERIGCEARFRYAVDDDGVAHLRSPHKALASICDDLTMDQARAFAKYLREKSGIRLPAELAHGVLMEGRESSRGAA